MKRLDFCEQVKMYRYQFYVIAHAILKNEEDAQDAVCSAILKAYEHMDQLKNPQIVTADVTFANRFAAVLSEAITPVVPAIISQEYTKLYDVVQVGWGDVAKYEVESNELTFVS